MRPKTKRNASAAEIVEPAQVEGAVADGLLIARSAASIAVANHIIVRALRDQVLFDSAEVADAVRDELGRLASEQAGLASRMVAARTKALKSRGRSRHQFDYRAGDNEALAARETIYTTIATRLGDLAVDEEYVDGIVVAARDRAWNDIGATVLSHAKAFVLPEDDYEDGLDDRLKQLLDVDFAALVTENSSKKSD